MNPKLIALGLVGVGALVATSSAEALQPNYGESPDIGSLPQIPSPDDASAGDVVADFPRATDYRTVNLTAFLKVLRIGESGDDYSKLVGGGHFASFADHPAIGSGRLYGPGSTFAGIVRPDGRRSTAAGGYQITGTTWIDIRGLARWGSFDPDAQDQAAIFLLDRRGALEHVREGRIAQAVRLLPAEWEIFTLARWNADNTVAAYIDNGGYLA